MAAAPQALDVEPGATSAGATISLADLPPGRPAIVAALDDRGPIGARLGDLGFLPGTAIAVVRRAPLCDPTVYVLRGCELALRRSEADRVRVRLEPEPAA